jgi:hypothetical protein
MADKRTKSETTTETTTEMTTETTTVTTTGDQVPCKDDDATATVRDGEANDPASLPSL